MAKPWKAVAGGMLRTEVRVERPTGDISDTGGTVPGEPEVIIERLAASIEPLEASFQMRELFIGEQLTQPVTHLVRTRRATGRIVTTDMYFVELQDPERRLEIVVRREDVRGREMQFICKEQEVIA